MKYTKIVLIVSSLVALVVVWIVVDNSKWEEINSTYIRRIKTRSTTVDVEIRANQYLFCIIDSSVFNGFRPAESLSKVIDIYGKPDNYVSNKKGIETIEYWYDNVRIEYMAEYREDEGTINTLYSYPNNVSIYQVLDSQIVDRIDEKSEKVLVLIHDKDDKLLMFVVVKGQRVEELRWFN